jgi:hypothetical protein
MDGGSAVRDIAAEPGSSYAVGRAEEISWISPLA